MSVSLLKVKIALLNGSRVSKISSSILEVSKNIIAIQGSEKPSEFRLNQLRKSISLEEAKNITYKEMGLILGAWQFIYIFFALPAGIFVDKYGLKISIFISAIIITLSLLFRGFSESFFYMWLAVALFGVGGPLISVSAPKTALIWSNQKNRVISNIQDAGDSYYETYTDIKKGKDKK